MVRSLSGGEAEAFQLFQHRNRLLTAIRSHILSPLESQSRSFVFHQCCMTFKDALGCGSVWAGAIDRDRKCLILPASTSSSEPSAVQHHISNYLTQQFSLDLAGLQPLCLRLKTKDLDEFVIGDNHCDILPVRSKNQMYGFIVIHYSGKTPISELKQEFVTHVIDDIAQALLSQDTDLKLKSERDFNKEIVDTIQALMVTIRPCGTIVSFNERAEKVTGYSEQEVHEKYWVDVLITPQKRREIQRVFSNTLKGTEVNINFGAPLLTKDGRERSIRWHGSIRHNIEKGQLGLVMLGIDETENLMADQQLNMFTARWKKIFIAIQDPVLVVSSSNIIIEANPAACAAAKKRREDVVGKTVCNILHGGGHGTQNRCPLEQLIGYQKSQITETELHGLHGRFMLTVTPILEENGEINTTLFVARNLTEEEVVRVEAVRAAHLAAIGELASGVAHEINNPINGIINYAQIILDDPEDPEAAENLGNIISESKRVAAIVSNLLDFARRRDDVLTPSPVEKIVSNSLQLVDHLLKKDGIDCSVTIAENLPHLICNEQQLQQVVLNMISNARYALNKKFLHSSTDKKLEIKVGLYTEKGMAGIRLTFIDNGVGIQPEIRDRLFDPFFSTKPKGEGTGLGLSISHGLIKDHGGNIRVQSTVGEWTRFTIELPVKSEQEVE